MPTITLIAALGNDRIIGNQGKIPWHLPKDFAHFKEVTLGKPIVMGKNTWLSLPKRPLPGRRNVVLSFEKEAFEGAENVTSPEKAIELLGDTEEIMIIGGAMIYQAFLPLADKLILSHIPGQYSGDVFFPAYEKDFSPEKREEKEGFSVTTYVRKK